MVIFNKGLLRRCQDALGVSEEVILSEMLLLLWHPEMLQEVYLDLHGLSHLGRCVGTLAHTSANGVSAKMKKPFVSCKGSFSCA